MAANAKEFYAESVSKWPPKERLRVAAMILNDLTSPADSVDLSHSWNDEDIQDLTSFALSSS